MVALATRKEENMANKNDIRIDVKKLHPLLRLYLERMIKYANDAGIYIIVTEGLRTVADQDALYAKGRTKPGPVVTNAKGSYYGSQHQWGIAFDICIANDGHMWDESYFRRVAEVTIGHCKHLGWGGYWTKEKDGLIDRPHFYLDNWGKNPLPLKKKYGVPDKFMKTFTGKVTGTKDGLTIWSKNKKKQIKKNVPNGEVFNILSKGIRWARIEYNGIHGYVLKKYLK